MDEEEEISAKLIDVHSENELGIKFASFEWTSSTGIANSTRINCYNKEKLKFEVLKGVSIKDIVQHEHELESAKEMLAST